MADVFGLELTVSPSREDGGVDVRAVLDTAMVNTMAFYLAVSGWRVWARARAADRGVFPKFDSILAAIAMAVAVAFGVFWWMMVYAVATMPSAPKGTIGPHLFFTVAASIFLLDASLDLRIGIKRRGPRTWFKHA